MSFVTNQRPLKCFFFSVKYAMDWLKNQFYVYHFCYFIFMLLLRSCVFLSSNLTWYICLILMLCGIFRWQYQISKKNTLFSCYLKKNLCHWGSLGFSALSLSLCQLLYIKSGQLICLMCVRVCTINVHAFRCRESLNS